MKYLLIFGLLFSTSVFADSAMYDEVMQEIKNKQIERQQKANDIRQQKLQNKRNPRATAINEFNPEGKLTNEQVLIINQQVTAERAQREQIEQQQIINQQQNKYLSCMNNRVAATGKPLATLVREDQATGFSICN